MKRDQMKRQGSKYGEPRLAICQCGEKIIPTGIPGTCWIHKKTMLSRCDDSYGHPEEVFWATPTKILDWGKRKVRKTYA